MEIYTDNTLPKEARLKSKLAIDRLLKNGRYGYTEGIRFCYNSGSGEDLNRIMVSVPKRNFKRAVKRNLLKRRIREAYRTQKGLLPETGHDILFTYTSKEVLDSARIAASVADVLRKIAAAAK